MVGRVVVVGLLWVNTSAIFSTFGNALFLRTYGDAYSHTFARFAFSSLLGLAWSLLMDRGLFRAFPGAARRLFLPSFLLLSANLLNSMGMLRSGITITYVVKSLIPFFTVMICRARGQLYSPGVYASLVPVCLGVALASATDLDFDWSGFVCALGSTLSQTLLNVIARERIQELGLSGSQAFVVKATICTALSAPLLAVSHAALPQGLLRVLSEGASPLATPTMSHSAIVFIAALAYASEYTLNFLYIPLCSSLTFSVTDITRRLGTIAFGALLFGKPLTPLNMAGVGVSLLGVVGYTAMTNLLSKTQVPAATAKKVE